MKKNAACLEKKLFLLLMLFFFFISCCCCSSSVFSLSISLSPSFLLIMIDILKHKENQAKKEPIKIADERLSFFSFA